MALRFVDSMQHYSNIAGQINRKWTAMSFASWNGSGGRRNGPYLSGAGMNLFKTLTHQARYIEGGAFKYAAGGNGPGLTFNNDNTQMAYFQLEVDATVSIFANGSRLGRSSLAVADASSWHYYEMDAQVGASSGTVTLTATVRVDGAVYTTYTGTTNILTANLIDNAATINQCGIANAGTCSFQDFYCLDTSTSDVYGNSTTNTAFLGDVEVDAIFPNADAGTEQWTIGAGGDGTHSYTCIDETAPDDDTSYVVTTNTSTNNSDSFHYQPISGFTGTILGCQYLVCARKDAEGIRQIDLTVGTHTASTIEFLGTANYLSDYYVYYITPLDSDMGVAWTTNAFGTAGTETFGFQCIG